MHKKSMAGRQAGRGRTDWTFRVFGGGEVMCMSILAQRVASADEPLSLLRLGARPGEIRAFPGWSSLLPCTASKLVQAKDRAGALERVPLATLRCSCSCSCLLVLRLVRSCARGGDP